MGVGGDPVDRLVWKRDEALEIQGLVLFPGWRSELLARRDGCRGIGGPTRGGLLLELLEFLLLDDLDLGALLKLGLAGDLDDVARHRPTSRTRGGGGGRGFDLLELDLELQGGVRTDLRGRSLGPVGEVGRDVELPLGADRLGAL